MSATVKKHWRYLTYVVRHKRFVFQAGRKRGVPLLQLIVHDWSKFLPDEWGPYAEWFYGNNGGPWYAELKRLSILDPVLVNPRLVARVEAKQLAFLEAFVRHLHRSPHHWQHWILTPDSRGQEARVFPMPERYAREMVADWDGAGRAINGRWDTPNWYATRGPQEKLHPTTRTLVETLLSEPIDYH